ncbi:MAG: hypothetical protein KKA28_17800, partial [Planctomycetes bacterium]|nr:hypothetical protein [Planctomycetota bacterium]MCG2685385.1 hypothetical protein [Planctomycetales bacterium]
MFTALEFTSTVKVEFQDFLPLRVKTALSEKMPILPKLNRAIRLPELFASGNRWTLPADNAFDAKSIVRRG